MQYMYLPTWFVALVTSETRLCWKHLARGFAEICVTRMAPETALRVPPYLEAVMCGACSQLSRELVIAPVLGVAIWGCSR